MADESADRSQFRPLRGISAFFARSALVLLAGIGLIWAGDVLSYTGVTMFTEQYLSVFLGISLFATFLLVPGRSRDRSGVPWYDILLALTAVAVAAHFSLFYPTISRSLSATTPDRLVIAGLGLLLVIEATRRLFGWVLVIIAVVFCVYAAISHIFPGLLYSRASSVERILVYNYFDTNGVFGIALKITASMVIAFVFFGVCLMMVGGEAFFTHIAMVLMGRYRGGAAKVAIVSSVLFGTVSGSAIANVVVSGSVTIGMMKRNGYPAHVAGAIEAVASTGGQITPPVMGITAFLIAENLNMSYGEVAVAALLPALFYYVSLFLQTDFEAARLGLRGLPVAELPRARDALKKGWVFLLPLAVLIFMLIIANFPPNVSGIAAGIVTLGGALVFSREHLKPANIVLLLERTGKGVLSIAVVCALAGIVMGALNLSGILFKMTLILSSLSFGHPIVLLAIVAVICIVLGMGLPSIVIYVLLSVLIAPALVSFGIEPISAHLFIYYFGMLSMITPPICLATFTAMALSGSKLWPTGLAGMRFGIVAYIMPFVFVFHPELVMKGSWYNIVLAALSAGIGVGSLSIGLVGFLFKPMTWLLRIVFIAGGIAMMPAPTSASMISLNLIALGCTVMLLVYLILRNRQLGVERA
jgi:TRAP transporter 4TM/12TM fusion protein